MKKSPRFFGSLRRHPGRWLTGFAVAGAAVMALSVGSHALADDDHEHERGEYRERSYSSGPSATAARQTMPKQYQAECASCHMAYEPRFLPAASWKRMMGNLQNHYGSDASIDAASVKTISTWLQANAGNAQRTGSNPDQDRITKTRWFVRKHDEVSAATFRRASIRSAANCAACHPGAEKGNYDEHSVRIPR